MGCSGSRSRGGDRVRRAETHTSQDQDVATDVGCAFDGAAASTSETTFSDGEVGLSLGFMSQGSLGLTQTGIVGYFLRGWQSCHGSSVPSYDRL